MSGDATESLLLSSIGGSSQVTTSWRLEVVAGPDRGKTLERSDGTIVLGAGEGCDLKLSDAAVSRKHAEIHLFGEGAWVIDLGSRNGTRVGGQRVSRVLVMPGSSVTFGASEVRFYAAKQAPEPEPPESFGEFTTRSEPMQRTLQRLDRAAKTTSTILLEGETGTGKEILARAIHASSPRASGPFVVADCSAMVETLLESQLFGHQKGAFTGAIADQLGAFEAAAGGTLFLDEIGELPLSLQPKLLRALEARTIKRLGTTTDRAVDVRIVAATHRDLEVMVKSGNFRSDLYYRVAVVRVKIPPLRERPEDVTLLAQRFLAGAAAILSPEARLFLSGYSWPGNARELRNILEAAVAVSEPGAVLQPEDLLGLERAAPAEESPGDYHAAKERAVAEFEKRYVRWLVDTYGTNISRASKEAGITRNALAALLKRAGIK